MRRYRLSVVLEFDIPESEREFHGGASTYRVTKSLKGSMPNLERVARKKLLFGPEPWKFWGAKADEPVCCSGFECCCGGETVAQSVARKRKNYDGRVVGFVVHERDVTRWRLVSDRACQPDEGER